MGLDGGGVLVSVMAADDQVDQAWELTRTRSSRGMRAVSSCGPRPGHAPRGNRPDRG